MSRSQAFYARILNYRGIETSVHLDPWGVTIPRVESVAETIGLRIVSRALVQPEERDYRVPQSKLERWLDDTARGVRVEIDPETTEINGMHHWNAIDFKDYRRRPRAILSIRGLGIIPELDDQKVLVETNHAMMHRASMKELESGVSINDVKLTPYVNADPRQS